MPDRVWMIQGHAVTFVSSAEATWRGLYGTWRYDAQTRRGLLVLDPHRGDAYQLDTVPSLEAAVSCARGFDLGAASGLRQPPAPREGGAHA